MTERKTVMKRYMNLSTHQPNLTSFNRVINAFYELINDLTESKKNFSENIDYCKKFRQRRKAFEKMAESFVCNFDKASDKRQAEVEMFFYNSLKNLEQAIPKAKSELTTEVPFLFSKFLTRELDKSLGTFKKYQKIMADRLYPDHRKEILSNPALYQELVDAWGDLAADED